MSGGGGDHGRLPSPPASGGEFLLQLLRRPPHQPSTHQPPFTSTRPSPPTPSPLPPAQNLSHDPAVAAVGPTVLLPNGHDLPHHPHPSPWSHSPPFAPHNFFPQGFPQNPNPSWSQSPQPLPSDFNRNLQLNRLGLSDDIRKLGSFGGSNPRPDSTPQHEQSLMFGSFASEIRIPDGTTNKTLASAAKVDSLNSLEGNFQNSPNLSQNMWAKEQEQRGSGSVGWGRQQQSGNFMVGEPSREVRRPPPPGFPRKPINFGNLESGSRSVEHNVDKEKGNFGELMSHRDVREKILLPEHRKIRGDLLAERRLSSQLDYPGPPAGSNLHSASASDIEESQLVFHGEIGENRGKHKYIPRFKRGGGPVRSELDDLDGQLTGSLVLEDGENRGKHKYIPRFKRGGGPVQSELDDLDEQLTGSLVLEDGSVNKNDRKPRDKDYRSDTRGQRLLLPRMRNSRRLIECRYDIDRLNDHFLTIYESLIPPEEEKVKQKQLLTLLDKLVSKEWPEARLFLYGSCANSFGVSKSDIDVCLAIEDLEVNKSEVLLKLAEILQSDNLENVQALTRARVPIVKLMDPVTGISCDICINNVLAVVNTKLLRDYAKIDVRLRQLAFIVKHWAKSRGVNETYQGTLSSYAYVLMCIHFLQQRKPAILPCLQGMETTYVVTVDNIECAFFDQVEKLSGFGSRNRESIAHLVWAFFNYWAYFHDYANNVISVRTGSILSKRAKDWTRRIGNDRHLICIEDPFEISHDLGRVVDKYSIKVLREEFERAAEIMQNDPNPCVTLFQPYIPS